MKLITLLLISLIVFGCSDSLTNYHEVSLDEEFSLKVGESAIVSSAGITIKFKSVDEDSRCPIGLLCFWAGNAVVVLELKDSDRNKQTIKLNTYLEPKNVEYSNLIIDLKDLTPYPKSDEIIDPDDYVAKLIVKKKEN
jgi:hypothetical protein